MGELYAVRKAHRSMGFIICLGKSKEDTCMCETFKQTWILVPVMEGEAKTIKKFIETKIDRQIDLPISQNRSSLLLLSPKLDKARTVTSKLAARADFKAKSVSEFIELYDDFKKRYDAALLAYLKGENGGFPTNLFFNEFEKKNHYCVTMPDGSMWGLWTYVGEDDETEISEFRRNWIKVTSKHPDRYHLEISSERCPVCGEPLYKRKGLEHRKWCAHCYYEINK